MHSQKTHFLVFSYSFWVVMPVRTAQPFLLHFCKISAVCLECRVVANGLVVSTAITYMLARTRAMACDDRRPPLSDGSQAFVSPPAFVTIKGWSAVTSMGRTATLQAIRAGHIPAVRLGSRILIDLAPGLAWVRSLPACGPSPRPR